MSYKDTFIEAATDCPEQTGVAPAVRGVKPSVPVLEFELLTKNPYKFTQEELIFTIHVTRLGLTPGEIERRDAQIRAELFSKPHPCLRASQLPKRYGWGVHHDPAGRIAIYARGSKDYAAFVTGKKKVSKILKAMRNKRADA